MPNRNKARGSGWEQRLVARAQKHGLRAHRQPGSGVFPDHPNDAVVESYLVECKMYTDHPSMTQFMAWLDGVRANAKKHEFAGAFLAYNHKGSRKPVVMVDLDLFLDLLATATSDEYGRGA